MQTSPKLHTVIEAWFASWGQVSNGDSSWADRYLSRRAELHIVGSDPNEIFEGEEAFEHRSKK